MLRPRDASINRRAATVRVATLAGSAVPEAEGAMEATETTGLVRPAPVVRRAAALPLRCCADVCLRALARGACARASRRHRHRGGNGPCLSCPQLYLLPSRSQLVRKGLYPSCPQCHLVLLRSDPRYSRRRSTGRYRRNCATGRLSQSGRSRLSNL